MSVFLAFLAAVVFLNVICIPVNAIKVNGKIDAVVSHTYYSYYTDFGLLRLTQRAPPISNMHLGAISWTQSCI